MSFLLLCCLPLAACGVRPGQVDPPQGAEDIAFPRQYPDASKDIRPYIPPRTP